MPRTPTFQSLCVMLTLTFASPIMAQSPSQQNANDQTWSAQSDPKHEAYAQWENGPPADPKFFPIAVWLQDPGLASDYKKAGINIFVGLWGGPTEAQLTTLKDAGMFVIAPQNDRARTLLEKDSPLLDQVVGWMQGDEPDNAQPKEGEGYGPPVKPEQIIAKYERMREADPTRPAWLNLGKGLAHAAWVGRGTRTGHLEDYPRYLRGTDIASFDIYPVNAGSDSVHNQLWYVPQGVRRLRRWSNDRMPIWNCIETTKISDSGTKPSPHQIRSEVWLSIINGSQGITYFVHSFSPETNADALLDDPKNLKAVTRINAQIHELAPVINSPTLLPGASVVSSSPQTPIHLMTKKQDAVTYVFAAGAHEDSTEAKIRVPGVAKDAEANVIGEERTVSLQNGMIDDRFEPYAVHLYRIEQ